MITSYFYSKLLNMCVDKGLKIQFYMAAAMQRIICPEGTIEIENSKVI